jgi:DNA-binding LacI/PurR family transcriptional regulator
MQGVNADKSRKLNRVNNRMPHTIYDIAKIAGVSSATVSRVLNDPVLVSTETRSRVLSVISDLKYRPNAHAIQLVRSKGHSESQSAFRVKPVAAASRASQKSARSAQSYELELKALRKENTELRSVVVELSLKIAKRRRSLDRSAE